jgi:hypothetical protein
VRRRPRRRDARGIDPKAGRQDDSDAESSLASVYLNHPEARLQRPDLFHGPRSGFDERGLRPCELVAEADYSVVDHSEIPMRAIDYLTHDRQGIGQDGLLTDRVAQPDHLVPDRSTLAGDVPLV